ncbi:hypothetical protein TKK_0009850 [Trichogramma kaykai]
MVLHAANGSTIKTYGSSNIDLNFGLRRKMEWSFVRAEVPYSIFGADALVHFDLLPHLKDKRLIDNTTGLFAQGHLAPAIVHGIKSTDNSNMNSQSVPENVPKNNLKSSSSKNIKPKKQVKFHLEHTYSHNVNKTDSRKTKRKKK